MAAALGSARAIGYNLSLSHDDPPRPGGAEKHPLLRAKVEGFMKSGSQKIQPGAGGGMFKKNRSRTAEPS